MRRLGVGVFCDHRSRRGVFFLLGPPLRELVTRELRHPLWIIRAQNDSTNSVGTAGQNFVSAALFSWSSVMSGPVHSRGAFFAGPAIRSSTVIAEGSCVVPARGLTGVIILPLPSLPLAAISADRFL